MNSILVPIDGGAATGQALERAMAIADEHDAVVYAVTVVDSSGAPMRFDVDDVVELERAQERLVEEIAAACENGTSTVDVRGAVRRGRPVRAVLAYADEIDADLLVVGQVERCWPKQALFGSTADRLARLSPVPVLVVPADDSDETPTLERLN